MRQLLCMQKFLCVLWFAWVLPIQAQVDFAALQLTVEDSYKSPFYTGQVTTELGITHAIAPVLVRIPTDVKLEDNSILKTLRVRLSNGQILASITDLSEELEPFKIEITNDTLEVIIEAEITEHTEVDEFGEQEQRDSTYTYVFPNKLYLWQEPTYPQILSNNALYFRDIDHPQFNVQAQPGTGANVEGWRYCWFTPDETEIKDLYLEQSLDDVTIEGNEKKIDTLEYLFRFENTIPEGICILKGEIPYSIEIYNTPKRPDKFVCMKNQYDQYVYMVGGTGYTNEQLAADRTTSIRFIGNEYERVENTRYYTSSTQKAFHSACVFWTYDNGNIISSDSIEFTKDFSFDNVAIYPEVNPGDNESDKNYRGEVKYGDNLYILEGSQFVANVLWGELPVTSAMMTLSGSGIAQKEEISSSHCSISMTPSLIPVTASIDITVTIDVEENEQYTCSCKKQLTEWNNKHYVVLSKPTYPEKQTDERNLLFRSCDKLNLNLHLSEARGGNLYKWKYQWSCSNQQYDKSLVNEKEVNLKRELDPLHIEGDMAYYDFTLNYSNVFDDGTVFLQGSETYRVTVSNKPTPAGKLIRYKKDEGQYTYLACNVGYTDEQLDKEAPIKLRFISSDEQIEDIIGTRQLTVPLSNELYSVKVVWMFNDGSEAVSEATTLSQTYDFTDLEIKTEIIKGDNKEDAHYHGAVKEGDTTYMLEGSVLNINASWKSSPIDSAKVVLQNNDNYQTFDFTPSAAIKMDAPSDAIIPGLNLYVTFQVDDNQTFHDIVYNAINDSYVVLPQPIYPVKMSNEDTLLFRSCDKLWLDLMVTEAKGANMKGWTYQWICRDNNAYIVNDPSGKTSHLKQTFDISNPGTTESLTKQVFRLNYKNSTPEGKVLLEGEEEYTIKIYNAPPTPEDFRQKGDGTSGIYLVGKENASIQNYSFGHGYGNDFKEEEKTSSRYTIRLKGTTYPWVRSFWTYEDGTTIYSNIQTCEDGELSPTNHQEALAYYIDYNGKTTRGLEEDADGIRMNETGRDVIGIYDLNGVKRNLLGKGINLVKIKGNDGKIYVKKVLRN